VTVYDKKYDNFKSFSEYFKTSMELDLLPIKKIIEDKNQNIWILTNEKGLYKYNKKSRKINRLIIEDNLIKDIAISKNNQLLIAKDKSILIYKEEQNDFEILHDLNNFLKKRAIRIRTIIVDHLGKLWLGSSENGVFVFENESFQTIKFIFNATNSIPSNNIVAIYQSNIDKKIWIGYRDKGISVFDFITNSFTHAANEDANPFSIIDNYILSFYEDDQNIMWIGTISSGIEKYDKKKFPFNLICKNTSDNKLPDNVIFSIYKKQNMLYIGSQTGGLTQYNSINKKFITYSTKNSKIGHNQINCIKDDNQGHLWLATGKGLCKLNIQNNSFEVFEKTENGKEGLLYFLKLDIIKSLNQLWAVGPRGLFCFDINKNKWLDHTIDSQLKKISKYNINSIYTDSNENIWIGTFGNGLFKYNLKAKTLTNISKKYDFFCDNINTITEFNHKIWIDTDCGMASISNDLIPKFKRYEKELPDKVIYSIMADRNKNLWFGTNKGLGVFNEKQGKMTNLYTKNDGLQENEFNSHSAFKDDKGTMYFGGVGGISYFEPEKIIKNNEVLDTKLIYLKTQKRVINKLNQTIVLSPDENFIELSFANLNYSNSSKNTYQYMLVNVDENWVNSNNKNFCNYTNLAPGNYTFLLTSKNSDGFGTQKPAKIEFEIEGRYYQKLWFKILAILLVAGLIYYLLFIRRLNKLLKYKFQVEETNRILKEELLKVKEIEFNKKIAETELIATRSQINPHFLFNCLNSIKLYSLENNPEKASNYLSSFSRLIRNVLESSDLQKISLEKELETVTLYLEIEKNRLGKKLNYEFEIDDEIDVETIEIPPMLIQPFVENAIWHGIMNNTILGVLHIKVIYNETTNSNEIHIIDNGIGRAKAELIKKEQKNSEKTRRPFGVKLTEESLRSFNNLFATNIKINVFDRQNTKHTSIGTEVVISIGPKEN
jgi:ligand-binding sensor domain-containing protein